MLELLQNLHAWLFVYDIEGRCCNVEVQPTFLFRFFPFKSDIALLTIEQDNKFFYVAQYLKQMDVDPMSLQGRLVRAKVLEPLLGSIYESVDTATSSIIYYHALLDIQTIQ